MSFVLCQTTKKKMKFMKTLLLLVLCGLVIASVSTFCAFKNNEPMLNYSGDNYEAAWKTIDSLERQGLTKSALEKTEELYARAKKDNNPSQVIKTLLYRGKYQARLEEYGLVKAIERFEDEVETADFPVKPILQSMLAEMYTKYLNQNRYKFNDRTNTLDFESGDIKTWTIEQLNQKSVQLYEESLKEVKSKRVKLTDFNVLTNSYNTQELYPTLFDFLTDRAVKFFSNERTYLTQPAYKFYVDQEEAFAPARRFMSHNFQTKDSTSLKYLNLLRYQDWLAFHINDDKQDALIHIDLKRLNFVNANSIHPEKERLYQEALEALQSKYKGQEAYAEISHYIAQIHLKNGNKYQPSPEAQHQFELKKALEICEDAIKRYPESYGGIQCKNLKQQILRKSISHNVEKVNPTNQAILTKISYRNIKKVWVKSIKLTKGEQQELNDKNTIQRLAFLKKQDALKTWSLDLPDQDDYQEHSLEFEVDAQENGIYYFLISDSQNFTGHTIYSHTYVSNIAFLNRYETNGQAFYLADRGTGKPLEGVKAQLYVRKYNSQKRKYEYNEAGSFTSDEDGFLLATSKDRQNRNFRIKFNHNDDELYLDDSYYHYYYGDRGNNSYSTTTFFTDRAIYRPGQTVYFKGIVLNVGTDRIPKIKSNYSTTVQLMDANYQKAAEVKVTTNEYGTFSGTFTAPSSGLLGNMTIKDISNNNQKNFRVEEYKRPKFEVEFKPVTESYRLNDKVKITGFAKAYAGSNIDGAKVTYRVVRQTRFPYWSWWRWGWYNPWQREDMEITNGDTVTDEKGEFLIEFDAIPDKSIPKDKKPEFTYKVLADVVDITGETHSGESMVKVGYIALNADITVPEQMNQDSIGTLKLSTLNLNGEFEQAKGTVKIQALESPDRIYKTRFWSKPDQYVLQEADFKKSFPNYAFKDEDEVSKWGKGQTILSENFDTQNKKEISLKGKKWPAGKYQVTLNTEDKYGEDIEVIKYFTVFEPKSKKVTEPEPIWHHVSRTTAQPGQVITVNFGSAVPNAYFLYEVIENGKTVKRERIHAKGIVQRKIAVLERHRGNLFYKLALILDNRAYAKDYSIAVPWSNKELKFEYATFRDKLYPGQEEEWQIKLIGPKGDKVAAEMVAGLYDASLDAFVKNYWNSPNYPSNSSLSAFTGGQNFTQQGSSVLNHQRPSSYPLPSRSTPYLNWFGFSFYEGQFYNYGYNRKSMRNEGMVMSSAPPPPPAAMAMEAPDMEMEEMAEVAVAAGGAEMDDGDGIADSMDNAPGAEQQKTGANKETGADGGFSDVKVRTNLNETVFFFPHLKTDEKGNIIIKFTMNEALTRWNFMGFAHTKDYKFGFTDKEIVTQKDLMVMPNPPRFFRESDEIHFTAKVSNLSEKDLTGSAKLELYDALTMKSLDKELGNVEATIPFDAKQGQSAPLSWKLSIPKDIMAVTYRVIAKAGNFSDGEESSLPVLTNRMMVTETMPLPVRGLQTKKFEFKAMKKAGESNTLTHHKMTLEFTENPAWYAVQALPYLMEYPYQCTEQIFSRYYANSIATSVANSHPKIKRVFEQWKNTDAMLSNLSKNEELKSALLEETPWVLQAQSEEQQKKRIGLLFDLNKMAREQERALKKIKERQLSNGGFSWFPGGRDSWYITQYLVEGLGHLDRLGVAEIKEDSKTQEMVSKAVNYIDDRIVEKYEDLLERVKKGYTKLEDNHLDQMAIHYLYARSFFLNQPIKGKVKTAMDYYLGQADEYWLSNGIYMQGYLALALHRMDRPATPKKIVKALEENSLNSEEMGMYWKYTSGYYWYQLPIETHALMIEVFDEVANDAKAVDDLKVWLLKNKQTNHWKTTKATASAVYAMLLRGDNWLLEDKPIDIKIGGKKLDHSKLNKEAGTGYFKTAWKGDEVTMSMADVEVKNSNKVVAWGAMYWQYFEQLDKIKTFEDTPLKLMKKLFREENTATGPAIRPVYASTALAPGDKLIVRIELRVDRDMEYVHMKDMRASGFEPMNVLSHYKWQGGLGYYESTRDASTNFFFDFLPKGTYVFEYPLRVNHRGDFSNGITTIQCMYAPEFTSHSEGIRVKVD